MIHTGDALEALCTMRARSVQICVTSPPYWGLRDYGIPGRVWGGDPDHSHEWGETVQAHATNHTDKRRWNHARNGRGEAQPIAKRPGRKRSIIPQGSFCSCGAWFGVLGLEPSPELYVAHIVEIFREVRRVLKDDGTLWLNLGDCYATGGGKFNAPGGGKQRAYWKGFRGDHQRDPKRNWAAIPVGPHCQPNRMPIEGLKPKDLVGMPWRVAFALQADGWFLRSDIIWHKPNPMPESVTDRPTKSHEYLFLLAKSEKYFYDADAIKEPCSPDTHARYARGRGDRHKWSDGGPGHQTIATNKPGSLFYRSGNKAKSWGNNETPDRRKATGVIERQSGIPWTPGVNPKALLATKGCKQNAGFCAAVKDLVPTRNKRTVWRISTKPYSGAHFATFPPALVEPCILAGSRPAGKRCDCGELIETPLAGGPVVDPTLQTGRAGMNRVRRENEGTRPIARREQRWYAREMAKSPHRKAMRRAAGPAFAHYIRTDYPNGARPLPEKLLKKWLDRGWLTPPPPCRHATEAADVVLDPFAGAGTTGLVAEQHARKFVGIELNPQYVEMAEDRMRSRTASAPPRRRTERAA